MIGLDTNVIVRYLTQDDKKQSTKANKLIDEQLSSTTLGFITLISLVEVTWVLESCYEQPKEALVETIHALLTTKQFLIENAEVACLALKRYINGNADFSDSLIAALSEHYGCYQTFTFDKKGKSVGMEVL